MLTKTWRIILLVVALLLAIWRDLLGVEVSQWIAVIALAVLLIAEFMGSNGTGRARRKEAEAPTQTRERTTRTALPTRARSNIRRRRRR